jgi:IS66 C-terminal element
MRLPCSSTLVQRICNGPRETLTPETYLRYVLARIADQAINRIDELAPWVVAEQLLSAV